MIVLNTMENDARVMNEARTLARAGHDVVVHALMRPGVTPRLEQVEAGFTIQRSKNWAPRPRRTGAQGQQNSAIHWITFLAHRLIVNLAIIKDIVLRRPDATHAHDVNTLPTAWLACTLTRSSLVYDAHEISTGREGYGSFAATIRRVEHFLMPRAAATITTTEMRADHFVAAYGVKRPLVIQNRPRLTAASGSESSILRNRLRLAKDRPIVLYQGGLQKGRGLSRLIDIIPEIKDAEFVFVGGGPLVEQLQSQAVDLGVDDRTHFIDTVPYADLAEITRSADIGVQPLENTCLNHETTDSNKLFEYMHAGLAVIASDLPEIRKVITDADCGLLVPDSDTRALRDAVKMLVQDAEMRGRFRENSRTAAEKYSWQSQEHILANLYANLNQENDTGAIQVVP